MEMMLMSTLKDERYDPVNLEIPSLLFDNRTEFDALQFDTIDQHGQAFHIIVAKTGYTFDSLDQDGRATLEAVSTPSKLCIEDQHYDNDLKKSIYAESDLSPYKPYCDVVVNANAYAPQGQASRKFKVQLHVAAKSQSVQLPELPQSLNPLQKPSALAMTKWQREVEDIQEKSAADDVLINKVLQVTGSRQWHQDWRGNWKLSEPELTLQVPIRYEYAFGGQCRLDSDDARAANIAETYRLAPEQKKQHPQYPDTPAAHEACMVNPVGCGFMRQWYLDATESTVVTAPQIELSTQPYSEASLKQIIEGHEPSPAGFGIIDGAWRQRMRWFGKFDETQTWAENKVPLLPEDFDFRYWNCAPEDQQCVHLQGGERITLVNLCAHTVPYARKDSSGNTILQFVLPPQSLFVLLAGSQAQLSAEKLAIDTVIISPDEKKIELVWRVCLPADGEFAEARLLHADEPDQLERLEQLRKPSGADTNLEMAG
jgi:hypothetical protein